MGQRVMVYYNLNRETFSISYLGKVIMHADYVRLKDVEFRVRPGGKERVRDEKRKNVHEEHYSDLIVTYNPYVNDTFVLKGTDKPVYFAEEVEMVNMKNKIYITQ
jgi:hypothetical protein